MSASQQKRYRKDVTSFGTNTKEDKDGKKFKRNATIVIAVIVVLALVVMFLNSNLFYRHVPALEVNGQKYTIADYNFYYYTAYYRMYSNYYNMYGSYASAFMPGNDEMRSYAISLIQETQAFHDAAVEAGYTLSDEAQANLEQTYADLEAAAKEEGVTSVNRYLKAVMGRGVNFELYKENMAYYTLAQQYSQEIRNSFTYSADQLATYYDEHKDTYDVISYRMFFFDGSDGDNAMAKAEENAKAFESAITDEDSFAELALQYAPAESKEQYENADATLYAYPGQSLLSYAAEYAEWLLDAGRDPGETTVVEAASGSGYYVVYFVDRNDNDYNTKNVRHILFATNSLSVDEFETEEAYEAALEELKAEKLAQAEDIYAQWKAGGATEESFAQLADEYSEDGSEGGLYEDVHLNQMVKAFNDWCFDAERKAGDTDIVETEYGYHIMYFIGDGEKYCDSIADEQLRSADYSAWIEDAVSTFTVSTHWVLKLAR